MPKRLICLHPHASYHFGEVQEVDDTMAAGMLGIKVGQYQCWELLKDLGPDAQPKAEPKAEAPKVEAPPAEPEPSTEEAPKVQAEEPKSKRGSKQ